MRSETNMAEKIGTRMHVIKIPGARFRASLLIILSIMWDTSYSNFYSLQFRSCSQQNVIFNVGINGTLSSSARKTTLVQVRAGGLSQSYHKEILVGMSSYNEGLSQAKGGEGILPIHDMPTWRYFSSYDCHHSQEWQSRNEHSKSLLTASCWKTVLAASDTWDDIVGWR